MTGQSEDSLEEALANRGTQMRRIGAKLVLTALSTSIGPTRSMIRDP